MKNVENEFSKHLTEMSNKTLLEIFPIVSPDNRYKLDFVGSSTEESEKNLILKGKFILTNLEDSSIKETEVRLSSIDDYRNVLRNQKILSSTEKEIIKKMHSSFADEIKKKYFSSGVKFNESS